MRLYQSRRFVWNAPAAITDARGQVRFRLLGDAFAPTRRLYLRDLAGREAAFLRQTLPSLFPRYELEIYGRPAGALCVRDHEIIFQDSAWQLTGSPEALHYDLVRDGETVAICRPQDEDLLFLELPDPPEGLTALGLLTAANCLILSGL